MIESEQNHPLSLNPLQLTELSFFWANVQTGVVIFLIIITITVPLLLFFRWKKKRLAPKNAALAMLNSTIHPLTPSRAIEVVRQVALSYYPRERIAKLHGQTWCEFLDQQVDTPIFMPKFSLWQENLYTKQHDQRELQQDLIDDCELWIKEALPLRIWRKR